MAGRLRSPSRPLGPRDEARMTLIEHLGELRSRVIVTAAAFFVATLVAWFFRKRIFDALLDLAPTLQGELAFTGPAAALVTDVKLSLFTAFLVTVPILLYQAWAFVAPAVGDMGRVFTYTLIALASSLFLAGVAFGYFVVLPIGLDFLISWGDDRYEEIITGADYLPFVTRSLLAFGIVFELPAATYVGARLQLVDAPFLRKYRRHAIVINFLVAAVITPGQDPFTFILMAIPMVVMYELSIFIARYVNPVSEVSAHEIVRQDGDELDDYEGDENERLYDENEEVDRRDQEDRDL